MKIQDKRNRNIAGELWNELHLCTAETLCVDRTCRTSLVIVNSDIRENGCGPQNMSMDPQLRSMLQWVAASLADIPHIQLTRDKDLKQVITSRPNPPLFIYNRFSRWQS